MAVVLLAVPTVAAASPSTTLLSIRIFDADSGAIFLSARGTSPSPVTNGIYEMSASVRQLPCPGRYVYEMASENQFSGAESSYRATLLLAPRSSAAPCGMALPMRPGSSTVAVAGEHEPFWLHGERQATGAFYGEIRLREQPVCHKTYALRVTVELDGWRRYVAYRVTVGDATATAMGTLIPECGP